MHPSWWCGDKEYFKPFLIDLWSVVMKAMCAVFSSNDCKTGEDINLVIAFFFKRRLSYHVCIEMSAPSLDPSISVTLLVLCHCDVHMHAAQF